MTNGKYRFFWSWVRDPENLIKFELGDLKKKIFWLFFFRSSDLALFFSRDSRSAKNVVEEHDSVRRSYCCLTLQILESLCKRNKVFHRDQQYSRNREDRLTSKTKRAYQCRCRWWDILCQFLEILLSSYDQWRSSLGVVAPLIPLR